jgi:hypothetical protein
MTVSSPSCPRGAAGPWESLFKQQQQSDNNMRKTKTPKTSGKPVMLQDMGMTLALTKQDVTQMEYYTTHLLLAR